MKKSVKIITIVIALILIMILICSSYYNFELSPVSKDTTKKEITINSNVTVTQIAQTLKDNHVIRDVIIFKLYLKVHGINNLKSGIYKLSESMTTPQIIKILQEGKGSQIGEIDILFREGINMRGIAKTIAQHTNNTQNDVFNLLKDETYIDSLISKYWFLTNDIKNKDIYYPLEGYLAPNTYRFANKNVSVQKIFETMLDQTNRILTKDKTAIEATHFTVHQFLTLASVVESEGVNGSDWPTIAEVFYNRLNLHKPFQSCVTVFYGLKEDMSPRPLLAIELATVNAYNTYPSSMAGKLPAGPISNPGEASIKATLHPNKGDYLFFVSDKYRRTYFSKTYLEHEQKIRELKAAGLWLTGN